MGRLPYLSFTQILPAGSTSLFILRMLVVVTGRANAERLEHASEVLRPVCYSHDIFRIRGDFGSETFVELIGDLCHQGTLGYTIG